MYDFVVVGAGPVGSYLSWKLSERGRDVLLLEMGEAGKPLKGTGHISKGLFDFVPKEESFIENEIRRGVFHTGDKSYTFGGDEVVSYVIDRAKFDRFLLGRAKKSGVEFRNEKFAGMRRGEKSILVNTEDDTYSTKLLAGCDGPNSSVRRHAGLPGPKVFLHGIFAKVDEESSGQDFVDVYLDRPKDFFSWRVPRGKDVEYGLATELGNNVREELNGFSQRLGFEPGEIYSGLIPMLPSRKTTSERIFLCGDAAAQTKPFTGGGIIYGLTAANIASEVADPDKPETIKKYEKKWRKELGTEIRLGNWIRRFYSLPPVLKSSFLRLGEKYQKKMHMDRPSSLFNI